jgi:hypothetical protein
MSIDRKFFFNGIRQTPFDGKLTSGQVSGTSAILDEWDRRKLTDLRWLAYMLATTKWETDHTMQPIQEGGGPAYLKSKKYYPWYGRGYVQLTWDYNYKKMTQLLKAADFRSSATRGSYPDLVANAELALVPDIAAFVMFEGMLKGVFTGKKLADYFNDAKTDWLNARRIINGTDRAAEIAAIAKAFFADLTLAV